MNAKHPNPYHPPGHARRSPRVWTLKLFLTPLYHALLVAVLRVNLFYVLDYVCNS